MMVACIAGTMALITAAVASAVDVRSASAAGAAAGAGAGSACGTACPSGASASHTSARSAATVSTRRSCAGERQEASCSRLARSATLSDIRACKLFWGCRAASQREMQLLLSAVAELVEQRKLSYQIPLAWRPWMMQAWISPLRCQM